MKNPAIDLAEGLQRAEVAIVLHMSPQGVSHIEAAAIRALRWPPHRRSAARQGSERAARKRRQG